MFTDYIIDKKIRKLYEYHGEYFDETDGLDCEYYEKLKDFAKKHGGLLFPFDDDFYLIINFINDDDFLIIPADYTL